MSKNIKFNLDFSLSEHLIKFQVKQLESRSLTITPFSNRETFVPTGVPRLFIAAGNDVFYQDKDITIVNGKIEIKLDRNMLKNKGVAYAEIEFKDNEGEIVSSTFTFDIIERIGEGGTIPGHVDGFIERYELLIQDFKNKSQAALDASTTSLNIFNSDAKTSIDTFTSEYSKAIKDFNSKANVDIEAFNNKAKSSISAFEVTGASKIDVFTTEGTNTLNQFKNTAQGELQGNAAKVDEAINVLKNEFNNLTAQQQQDLELLQARDGEVNLHVRLERDLKQGKIMHQVINDESFVTIKDSVGGSIHNIEILGSTWQNPLKLDEIVSAGVPTSDGRYEMSILSTNKNLFSNDEIEFIANDPTVKSNQVYIPKGSFVFSYVSQGVQPRFKILKNGIDITQEVSGASYLYSTYVIKIVDGDIYEFVATRNSTELSKSGKIYNLQLEEGAVATQYVPHEANKSSILMPVQLGSTLDGATKDRVFYDKSKGCLCIEQSTENGVLLAEKVIHDLPLSETINLSSFFGTTHLSIESGKAQATMKAKVSKSIGATVESLGIKTDILTDRVEAIEGMKESQNITYATEKGYQLCLKTVNGMVSKFKLKGRTKIVNANNEEVEAGTEGATLKSVGHGVNQIEVLSNNNLTTEIDSVYDKGNPVKIPNPDYKTHKKHILYKNDAGEWTSLAKHELRKWDTVEETSDGYRLTVGSDLRAYATGDETKTDCITDMTNTVYKLAQPKTYEVNNLALESYANETAILVDGGAIIPSMEFKVNTHIGDTIRVMGDRITFLENNMFGMFKNVLSGDMHSLAQVLYPQDFEQVEHKPSTLI